MTIPPPGDRLKLATRYVRYLPELRRGTRMLRLDAARRIPAQPVIKEAGVVLRGDLPVELGRVDVLMAIASNRAKIREQSLQLGIVLRSSGSVRGGSTGDRLASR